MKVWAIAVVLGAAPAVFLLSFFYLKDRYQREPLRHLATAFGLGLYAMVAAQGTASAAAQLVSRDWLVLGGEWAHLFDAFVLSGLIEEAAKWVILVAAVYHWDEMDEPLDGVVYGVAISLGFATLENILYIAGRGAGVAWARALFAVPAHALFGATMGYYAGRAKFRQPAPPAGTAPGTPAVAGRSASASSAPGWLGDQALCLTLPVLFHGGYNYALHHQLDARVWTLVTLISGALWVFVLRRVHRAQRASPFRTD